MWTLDPIDGTKGFLRGEQYAVCLAFLVDSQVQVGVIGCPNLPVVVSNPDGRKGCIFVAVRGQGAEQVSDQVSSLDVATSEPWLAFSRQLESPTSRNPVVQRFGPEYL